MPGGVCAVLDYDVDLMVDYVADMATRIVMPRSTVSAAFRKFVSQILTSTRLPSTTILLGMNYLAKHMNMMAAADRAGTSEGKVWRMLTVALLLGSKFLDDNTFQNKSWSEVSGIAVQELNTLEYEWLGAINWNLYVNLDESKDYNAWLKNWQGWLEAKKRQVAQVSRERLASLVTPIETDVARPRNPHAYSTWHQQQVAEYERLSSMKRNGRPAASSFRQEYSWQQVYPTAWHPPLTPPDSGYGTPEYFGSATSANSRYNDWFDRAIVNSANAQRQYQQSQTYQPYHHTSHSSRHHSSYPAYYNYSRNIWESNIADCSCATCVGPAHKAQPYFTSHSYGQPVMG